MPASVRTGTSSIARRRRRCFLPSRSAVTCASNCRAHLGVARVHVDHGTGFGIDETSDADVRQVPFTRILDGDCHHVVSLREKLERALDLGSQEIRDQENDRFVR